MVELADTYPVTIDGAHISGLKSYKELYKQSLDDPDTFWSSQAQQLLSWNKWEKPTVCSYNFDMDKGPVFVKWFEGAKLNLSYNALDRHIGAGHGDRVAFYWEGNEVGQDAVVTYQQLLDMTCQAANYLKSVGVGKGDGVTIYMPMIPELPAVMLACARIGAVHSVVFAGFSSESLASRIRDSSAKVVVTTTGSKRGPKDILLKDIVDDALNLCDKEGYAVQVVLTTAGSKRGPKDILLKDIVDDALNVSDKESYVVQHSVSEHKLCVDGLRVAMKAAVPTCCGLMTQVCVDGNEVAMKSGRERVLA
eukprot:gene12743-15992_t